MAEPPFKPVLQRPPGYRDPNAPLRPGPRPVGRKPVLPTTMYQKKKRGHCCRTCCCVFCCLLLILVLLLIIAVGVFYLWFDPEVPAFHLQSLEFPRFNVTTKPDGSYLDVATTARVEIKNPNEKLGVYYGKSHVEISLSEAESDVGLGSDELPGFVQAPKNVTGLKVETRASNVLVGPKVKSGFDSKSLGLNLEVRTSVGLRINGWNTGTIGVNVECGGVSLKKIQDGYAPKCYINLLKWINIH